MNVISVRLVESIQSFKQDMLNHPDFRMGTVLSYLPAPSVRNAMSYFPEGDVLSTMPVQTWTVDHDYIPALGMSVTRGRNFSTGFATDSDTMIINQAMARELEWENPVGKRLSAIISEKGDRATYEVIALANIIAWPVAYMVMSTWLREFAFRAPFSLWIPITAGAAAAAVALFTVGFLAMKTAVANPARSLRYE